MKVRIISACCLLVIEDDGVGFDVSSALRNQAGFVLYGTQERAALVDAGLIVESTPGKGSSVLLRCHRGEAPG